MAHDITTIPSLQSRKIIRLPNIFRTPGKFLSIAFALITLSIAAAAQVVVTPTNTQGWAVSSVTDGGQVNFVADGSAPGGTGALQLITGPLNSSRAQYSRPMNAPLSSVTDLSYYTKQNSGPPHAGASYALTVWLDGTPATSTNLVFEAYWNGSVLPGVWQQWDVDAASQLWSSQTRNAGGGCVTTAGAGGPPFYTVAGLQAVCPNAQVVGIVIYAGSFNPNYDVEADLVQFNNTVFDFETNPAAVVKITAADIAPAFDPQKWLFYNDENDTINPALGSFVTGPGSPPRGSGSAQITVSGTQRRNLTTYRFSGTPLADITTMKYGIYNPSAGNGQGPNASAYINFNVDFNGSDTWQRRLIFLPADNGGVTPDTWKEFDTINGGNALWRFSGPAWPIDGIPGTTPKTWSQILSQYPGVRIRVTDAHMGIRVGEPYPPGYTENIDSFTFGTAAGTTIFDFEPAPILVDDDAAQCPTATFTSIQAAINAATPGATIQVCAGNYLEDVNVNKAGIILQGAGIDVSTITGPHATGSANTITVSASGVTIDGFTITRTGNTVADWVANPQNQGINVSASTGTTIQNSKITGNRNGIYVGQSSHNTTIRRNIIDFNRTGVHIVDNNASLVEENSITNNWTMGILYRTEGGPAASVHTVRNNNISGNWYSEIENRDTPGTAVFNASGNYLGTTNPTRVTTTSGEPGYTSQIPVAYGGTSVPPASHPTIAGPQSARLDYSPFLNSGADTQPGTIGFQGGFANLTVSADSPKASGTASNIQEGIDQATTGGSVTALAGTYLGNVDINKALNLRGTPTVAGSLTASVSGSAVSPGFSPGIINSGSLSLTSSSNVNIEINGTAPGTGHDQLNVTGTVNLGGATLNVSSAFSPAPLDTFVIVQNDGADAVTGTFAGMPEGATFNIGLTQYAITYVGGTGNDVVLSATVAPCNTVSIPTGITTLPNQQVTVPINVDDTTGRNVLGYETSITYDSTKLTYLSFSTVGTLSNGLSVLVNSSVPGTLNIAASSTGPNPLSGAGVLLNLNFFATGSINAVPTPVTFNNFMFNEDNPCSGTVNGSVTIISSTISGNINYVNAPVTTPVPNTALNAVGSVNVSTNSDSAGNYNLGGMGSGAYTVTPSKTAQPIASSNGISNTDATRISQHLVGMITLNANQQMAADVSGNGTVSNLDASYIGQWSTGNPNPGSTGTWKFLPATRNYANVNTPQTGQDYDAILMGEVTGNWNPLGIPGLVSSDDLRKPAEDAVILEATRVKAESGTRISVPVTITDTSERGITGYQFDVRYDASVLEPENADAAVAGSVSEGMTVISNSPEDGLLKVFVYGVLPMKGKGTLLDLRFSVIGPAGSSTKLVIKNLMLNEGEINAGAVTGGVVVTDPSGESSLSGRLLTAYGQGVAGGRVTLTGSDGEQRTTTSNSFGHFEFGGLKVGEMYTISVKSRRYRFAPQPVSLSGSVVTVDLTALE